MATPTPNNPTPPKKPAAPPAKPAAAPTAKGVAPGKTQGRRKVLDPFLHVLAEACATAEQVQQDRAGRRRGGRFVQGKELTCGGSPVAALQETSGLHQRRFK